MVRKKKRMEKERFNGGGANGGVYSRPASSKLKEKEANAITEAEVLKVEGANKIRELYRAICEIPENPIATKLGRNKKLTTGGALWGGKFKK